MLLIDAIAIFGLAIIRKLMGDYFGTISSGFVGFFGVKGGLYSFLHVTGYAHNNAEIQTRRAGRDPPLLRDLALIHAQYRFLTAYLVRRVKTTIRRVD
jgi:hypothetical protein